MEFISGDVYFHLGVDCVEYETILIGAYFSALFDVIALFQLVLAVVCHSK